MEIIHASSSEHFAQAVEILSCFPEHQRRYYTEHLHIVNRYFDHDAYTHELANLERIYTQPGGLVLLALENDAPVGAVCLKKLNEKDCEMKRLFVPRAHRRKGIGRSLTDELLTWSKRKGFQKMLLDTGTFMVESQALYRKLGFRYIDAYYAVNPELKNGLVYMEKELV